MYRETIVDACLNLATLPPIIQAEPPRRSEYRIVASRTPQVMLRILGLFAQQDHVPDRVRMDVVDDKIWVALSIDGLNRHRAEVVAEKLRSLIDTETVDLG